MSRLLYFYWQVIATVFLIQGFSLVNDAGCEDELKEFVLHPDCRIELVAREPQVIDPIAIRFDDKGRLWVVEMRDYPTPDSIVPKSRIKILQDKDQDGFYETANVFADRLKFPTGLQPWRKGVIATVEGQVVYLADNDGDMRCDEERILFTGFATQNTQLRANHPTFGPDGMIYVANGLRNGKVQSPFSDKQVSLVGMDFRFDPISLDFEAVTGHGQFGMSFDSAGNRFVCTNRNPLKRILFESEYLKNARGIQVSQTVVDVAAAGPASRLFPISETWTTSNLHANTFTAACGVHVFEGTNLPREFIGNAFTCDPTANAVHREVISYREDAVAGKAKPGRDKVEFLASPTAEFRPVNLIEGPDGSLYVVDMRRAVIEHPQFMPPELKKRPDLRIGNDKGRIYRISGKSNAKKFKPRIVEPEKDLFARGKWWRTQSHRLLIEDSIEPDIEVIRQGLSRPESHPGGIIRALSFLKSRGKLRKIDFDFANSHYSDAVRAYAMKVCEGVRPDLIRAAITDESDRVRFQALLSCSKTNIKLTSQELATVALSSAQNQWVKQAWLIAAQPKATEVLGLLLDEISKRDVKLKYHADVYALCQKLIPLAHKSDAKSTQQLAIQCLQQITNRKLELEPLGLSFLRISSLRKQLIGSDKIDWKRIREYLVKVVPEGSRFGSLPDARMQLLGLSGNHHQLIESLAVRDSVPERRLMALRALQHSNLDESWLELLNQYRWLTFEERDQVLRAALARSVVARKLISEISEGRLKVSELGIQSRKNLLAHRDPEIKKLARKALAIQVPADRQKAFETYREALDLKTDAKRGRPIFEKNCASCHQLGRLGNRIGPDISDTRTKSKSQLLLDIIRPNAAIDNNYIEYVIDTFDGQTQKGILVERNATGVTLRQADNKKISIASTEIERIQSTGKSLMPVGLEQGLSKQQVADLISYLQNWRYLEQNIPFSENSNAK